ncbi:MAG TPA: DNA alkylation repair protein [Ktedonobacterales bacterium]|jgi:3-methyladenine DNA glycosylase AlkD|nr:DNA alkylation repair protein [Ktedonobacterales bacterium]
MAAEREAVDALVTTLRAELAHAADPAKAEPMRAYMKSSMPFLGIPTPTLRAITRRVFAGQPLSSVDEWRRAVLVLWREARYREERYAAIGLAGERRYRTWQTLDALPLYEEMIVSGAWWDYVDGIASQQLGALLAAHPTEMRQEMLTWSRDYDLWKRRAAIICQLNFGPRTDEALLFSCITPNLADREFFIRKGIGWALRQYARVAPDAVRAYVDAHAAEMSPLSRREALKRIGDAPTSADDL